MHLTEEEKRTYEALQARFTRAVQHARQTYGTDLTILPDGQLGEVMAMFVIQESKERNQPIKL